MSCTPSNPVLSKILPFTNNDVRRATSYLAVMEDESFTEWYKTITGREFDKENITDTSVDAVTAYNNREFVNTQDYIQNVRTSRTGVFGNDVAKEDHAINVLTTMFLKAEGAINKKIRDDKKQRSTEVKERNDVWVKKLLIGQLQAHLKNNKASLTAEQISFVSTLIKDLYDGGNYNSNNLFELVVNSPDAIALSKQFGVNTIEDFEVEEDAKENSEQDTRSKDGETVETLKADWTELADQRKNVDKNVSKDVKEWFAKLVKTNSTKFINDKPDANTDTYSGIPETVPFTTSFKLINNYGNFSNLESFINSLHTIAARFKEGSHLENAARLLEDSNNELMRNKIFVQLKQSIWVRNELGHREGKTAVTVKNRNTFPKLNLINKILNSFDKYIINPVAISEDDAILNTLKSRTEAINEISDEILRRKEMEQVTEELASIINKYNLGITREGLINYINNKSGNNISNILSVVDDLLEFNKVITNASEIVARNNTLRNEHYKSEYKKKLIDDSYAIVPFDESLITSTEGAGNKIANRIADRFKDYQIVNNEFNSINAENNLVSDILKNNYISKFFDRVNNKEYNDNPTDNLELRDYLVKFLDIPAYRNTNILVEQNLGDGKVIPGFLRVSEQGGYELTPYYREFGAELFNGIRNEVTGKSKSYKDINALEWDITMLNEYANSNDSFEITKGVRRAKFFTQTPSDAPKTFIINSYKLDIRGLFQSGAINHSHGIYVALMNNFTKELNAMAQAIDYLFETEDRDGIVVLKNDKLTVKKEFENLRESDARLNYHYSDTILKNGKPTGNVFQFRSLLIDKNSDDSALNLNKVFGEDGLVALLYGGSTSEVFMSRDANGELKINIDGAAMNAIHSYLENYIRYRINEGVNQYVSKKQYVDRYKNSSEAEFKNFIAEMVLNYEIQYNNLNDMFFGDEAFYKNSRDTIKRNKEYQAGGLCYAAFDLYNKEREFGSGVKVSDSKTIPITSSFKYITLEDVTNDGSILKDLNKQLNEAGVSKETKEFILNQFSKNRGDVTDAQSFITLDEFVRRMYLRGEYDNYKELVEALYDESKPIDGKLMHDLNKFIQVQKNFYYDLEVDNGLANPIQIKNAEFVLIPRFLGNTELGLLAKYMNDNGISQANFTSTEKATTSKVLTFWDSEGNIPSNDGKDGASPLKDFEGKLATTYKTGWYSNLYTQQDTSQHMEGENKAGLQIVKKLIDNISGTFKGQALIDDFFNCLTANIQDSFTDAAERIGVKVNNKGEIVYDGDKVSMDIDKFVALIKDELIRKGLDSNYRKYAEINPETGLPYMPAWSNLVRSKLESIVNSIFTNNVTSQKLRGFHAAQVANIGMNKLNDSISLTKNKTLLAPNGKPSNLNEDLYNYVRTKEFKDWFGDWENSPETASKILDENGEPMLVYHGGPKGIKEFKFSYTEEGFDAGIFFARDKNYADYFKAMNKDGVIYSAFINIKNPVDIRGKEITREDVGKVFAAEDNEAEQWKIAEEERTTKVVDGVVGIDMFDGAHRGDRYVVVPRDKEQIKVINNNISSQTVFEETNGYSLGRKLRYHPDGTQIIEVLLPKWMVAAYNSYDADGNLVHEVTLEDLQKEGLDTMIGYRIPTEGKQSVGIMKVVGLLNETQGSTIVLPDDWVLQTGADYDIDSVYGIYHSAYFDKNGKPKKIKYIDGSDEASTYRRYISYVNSLVDKQTRMATNPEFTKEEFKEARKVAKETVRKVNEDYDKFLSNEVKTKIKDTDETWAGLPRDIKDNLTLTFQDSSLNFSDRVDSIVSKMNFYETEYKDNEVVSKFAQQYRDIQATINEQKEFYRNVKENAEQLAIDYANETRRARLEEAIQKRAEIVGAMSLEEFSQLSVAQQNTKDARNNKIVDTFINIMNLSDSIGENLSSSNFEDIKKAKVKIFGKQVQYLNINSVIAQNWYRDTNMSGLRLKAISVNRDNFVSISNKSHTTISGNRGGFKFKYKFENESKAKKKYTELSKRFGKENVVRTGDTIFINHNRLGWSNDNLNIDGRLITAYSSETTALILDGVKEGGVRNVDLYTFDIYKSIVDCGSNYETSILFINQPVITELINRQNEIDNAFGESGVNPITTLKKELYIKYFEAVTGTKLTDKERKRYSANSINKILATIATNLGNKVFNENEFIEEGIDVELLRTNLNGSIDSNNIADIENNIKTLIAFEYYKSISEQINANMMVISSDKFGAGKSVNEIDSVLERIQALKDNNRKNIDSDTPVLTSEYKVPLIDSVYPRTSFNDINSINTDKSISIYPSLYYQLKYSCIATKMVIQDSGIFKTQTPEFKALVKSFGVRNIKTIQNLESFLINVSQAQSTFVNTNRFITTSSNEFIPSYNINLISSQDDTRARLYGYTDIVGKFDITDLSEKNVQNFMKLSPANKVAIMQSATNDDNLFKMLNVEYKGRRNTHDKITIIDSTISAESQYQMFRNIWHSNNPFIKLTAMDLIRYSIVVEGYRFKGGTISKIIPAELLYTEDNGIDSNNGLSTGTGIMIDSDRAINNLTQDDSDSNAIEELKDIFYRSNPNSPDIATFENKRYGISTKIVFNSLGFSTISLAEAKLRNIVRGEGSNETAVSYVKTNNNSNEQALYKVIIDGNFVHLIPLNRLEENEIGQVSINQDNNKYLSVKALTNIVNSDMNISSASIFGNALNASSRRFINNTALFIDEYNSISSVFDGVQVVTTPVKEGELNDTSIRYVIKSSNKDVIINNINVLEKQGINNYIVIVPNDEYEDIRAYISNANAKDVANQKEAIANEKISNNEIQLRTKNSDNSESPYYSQLKVSVNQTLSDVQVNGIGFVPVLQTVIDNTGFRSGGYVRYTKEGKNYVLTNLGRITSKSIKLTKDYLYHRTVEENNMLKLVYPRRSAIEQVIKENARLDKFANNNIVRVQTEEAFQNEDVLESAIVDNDVEINNYIAKTIESVERNNANVEEDALHDAFRSFNMLDIRANSASKLNDAMREQALKVINGYINRRIDDFLFTMNNFYVVNDADGDFLESWGITNKKLFDKMINDEELRTKYEIFLDDIHRFISDYSIIEGLQPYNIDEALALVETQEELDALRRTNEILKQIKDKFTRISSLNNILSRSTKMYFDTYISSLTNDPRIKSGMLEITAAIEDENFFQYYLADSQETHVPIVQIVLKKMMQQLRKAEIESRDRKISFTTEVSKIVERAQNAGVSVSLNDILDDSGNLLLPYDESFTETVRTLKDNIKIAQIKDPEGRNGFEYKKAKDALEKFLIENMERQYEARMYKDYYELDQMLDKYPATYTKLKKLLQEEAEILSTMVDNDYNTLTEQNQNRLEAILDAIEDMRSTIDSDGNYKENYYEANAVNNYFSRRRQLNLKYKYRQAKPAYEERYKQVMENLNYPKDSETYRDAEEWLRANTVSRLKEEVRESISNAYKETRRKNPLTNYIKTMMKGKYDTNGIVDGTKFTDVQVENIRKHEEQMLAAAVNRSAPNEARAQAYLDSTIEWVNTEYYTIEYVKANNSGKEEFEKWYKANHVYNPITEKYEPLMIWKRMVILNEAEVMEHFPKSKWLETKVKPEFINDKYVENKIQPSSDRYKNAKYYSMNEYQRELHESVSSLLDELVKDKRSRAYIGKGYLPNQAIEKENKGFEDYWQAFKRSHGWYDAPNKSDIELNLYKRFSNAPMLHSLSQIKLLPIREQQEGETKEEYAKYVEETLAANRELHKQRMEETKAMNNPNVLERLNAFIEQMYLFNSRNDVSRLAKLTINQLKNTEFIKRAPNGTLSTNRLLGRITGNEEIRTEKNENSNILKHFESQVRKLVFNEFELDEGTKSKVSRVLRNMVSSKFMMMNITGGIANVLYGKTQVQMEMAAGTYFKYRDFRKAENEYAQSIGSYFADAYSETTNSETNGIIRLFNILESDMATETYGKGDNPLGKLEDLLFITQSAGEHYMQNTTLLAMLNSHRVFVDDKGKASAMSYDTFAQNLREETLINLLNETNPDLVNTYNEYRDKIKKSFAILEQFNRFKQDMITNFLRSQSAELRAKFVEKYKEATKAQRAIFEELPTLRSQFELRNGVSVLKADSQLTNADVADFRNKVIAVNHHIHGIYDKIGANILQQSWAGALIMQFHKHLVPGFQKRFGYRLGHFDGIYSETRESVNKGSYISFAEFLTMPFRKYYELDNSNELQAVRALQGIGKAYVNFFGNMMTYYNILPEYDKANIRRVLSEWVAIVKAIALFVAGKLLLDEDDESTQIADYILYSADRLMSESIQYNPYGAANELQKLYSNPVAAFSIASDTYKVLAGCCSYIVTGNPDDIIYESGTYSGENKIKVNLLKQVPLVNQWRKHQRLGSNNSYYKVRQSPFSGISQFIANQFTDEED